MKLLSFGEIIWDVFGEQRVIGGAPLNLSAHAAACGCESYLVSAVGSDELGEDARRALASLSVSDRYVETHASLPTGRCDITLDEKGVPMYNLTPVSAYDDIRAENLNGLEFDYLCFGTLAIRCEKSLSALLRVINSNRFKDIYADLNIRAPYYSERAIDLALSHAGIVKISDEELPTVARQISIEYTDVKDTAKRIRERYKNLRLIIITLGANGSICLDTEADAFTSCNAYPTDVVSTVGAGDSFGAAFLASLSDGAGIADALAIASRISAFVVSHKEAIPGGVKELYTSLRGLSHSGVIE